MGIDFLSLLLTLKLALITTILLAGLCLPAAWGITRIRKKVRPIVEALFSMPLVLPPSVLGFYLLITFSPYSFVGAAFLRWFDLKLVFSFEGILLGSLVYSLPFMIRPLVAGIEAVPRSLSEAAETMGKSQLTIMRRVMIPNMQPAIWTGIILTFAHTVGEFGVVLMIGGNIPGATRVASIAIYEDVESMRFSEAASQSIVLCGISFALLALLSFAQSRQRTQFI